jgi:sulfatase modifying factor 1
MPINFPGVDTEFIENVRIKALTDPVIGGVDGAANVGLQDLADRTQWQKTEDRLNFKNAIEAASGGRNTIMWDDNDNWHLMVEIPWFNPAQLETELGNGPTSAAVGHSAFDNGVDGIKKRAWVSMFLAASGVSGVISQPRKTPLLSTFENAQAAASSCGAGWHVMRNCEYSALALLSRAQKEYQHGNTNSGSSHLAPYERGLIGYPVGSIMPGSGPDSWRHDSSPFGVADLVGNLRQWVDGIKSVNGKIYLNKFNSALAEASWIDTLIYFNKTVGNELNFSDTGFVDNNVYFHALRDLEGTAGFSSLAICATPILLQLLLFHTWLDDATPKVSALLGGASTDGLNGVIMSKLSNATYYYTRGGDFESGTIAGYGDLMYATTSDSNYFRLAYTEPTEPAA